MGVSKNKRIHWILTVILAWVCLALSSPSQAQPALEAYGKLPAFETAAISSSGKYFAIVARIKGQKQLILLEGQNKFVESIPLGEIKVHDVTWAGDEFVLVTTSQTEALGFGFTANKAEITQVMIHPMRGKKKKRQWVFRKQKSIANAVLGQYGLRKIDGRWKGFFGGMELDIDRNTGFYRFESNLENLIKIDLQKLSDNHVDREIRGEDAYTDWLLDAAGNVAARLDYRRLGNAWTLKDYQGNTLIEDSKADEQVSLISVGATGQSIIYSRKEDPDEAANIYEIPISGGAAKQIFDDIGIDHWYVDDRSSRLLGYRRSDGKKETVFFDAELNKKVANIRRAFSKVNVNLEDWSDDFSKVIVSTNGNGDSGNWWIVNLDSLRADQLGVSYPGVGPEQVGAISTVAYKAQDGLEMDGILTLPPGREAKNLPVIMFPHGGPNTHDEPEFDWWAQAFGSRGYAVFQPNFRGSTNRGAQFTRASEGEWGRKMQTDISDGLAELVKLGIVDPDKACIMGGSYGGYAALVGVTIQQGLYRCAISVAGVSDLNLMVRTDMKESGSSQTLRRNLEKELGKGRELRAISPANFAEQADAPILLIHGKDDTVVLYNQSTTMAAALKRAGKPYEFVALDGEDHWLSNGETRLKMLQAAVGFVLRHNPPN